MKFISLYNAFHYADRAFESNGKSLRVIMYDYPFFLVCTPKEAMKLVKKGYELAERL